MATFVIKDTRLLVGGLDVSGSINECGVTYQAEIKDATVMNPNGARDKRSGLMDVALDHRGFWEDEPDEALFNAINGAEQIITAAPESALVGGVGYSFKAQQASYAPGARVGEMFGFAVRAEGKGKLVRGTILLNGTLTATGNTSPTLLGAVSAAQKVYAAMHVLAVAGTAPTLNVKLQSDDASGFLSPIDRITFAQVTQPGAQFLSAVGPITDTYWRVQYTIAGTSPSFLVLVNVGIL